MVKAKARRGHLNMVRVQASSGGVRVGMVGTTVRYSVPSGVDNGACHVSGQRGGGDGGGVGSDSPLV